MSTAMPAHWRDEVVIRRAVPEGAAAIEALYRQLVGNPAVAVRAERIAQVGTDPRTAQFRRP